MKRLLNISSFFLGVLFIIFVFIFGNSFFYLTISPSIIYIFNIIFSILLSIRIYRSKTAIPLLVGYENYINKKKKYTYYYSVFFFLCIFLIFPYTSWLTSLLLWLTHSIFIIQSRYYSIEDIYFQNTIFHCFLINLSLHFFQDSHTVLFLVSFFIANGIIMFSAGVEKIKSPLWRSGKGTLSFMSLPHLVRKQFHFLHKLPTPIFVLLSFLVVFAESTLLFSPLHPYWLLIDLIILIGFSVSLFIIVDISFIGQIVTFCLCSIAFLWINEDFRLLSFDSNSFYNFDWNKITLSTYFLVLFLIVIHTISLLYVFFPNVATRLNLSKIQKFLTGINSPIGVFGEAHQVGFYTYRLTLEDNSQVLKTFCSIGYPSEYQFWHPRFFQAAMYPVTDFCISWNKYGEPLPYKKQQMIDLLFTGIHIQNNMTNFTQKIYLSVKKFDKGDSIKSYTKQNWIPICSAEFKEEKLIHFNYISTPPIVHTHFRSV